MLVVFTGALFSYAMFQGGFVSWFLFYMTSFLIAVTIFYTFIPIGKIDVSRKISAEKLVAGKDLVVNVTLTRTFPFPFLYLVVEDELAEDAKLKNTRMNTKVILSPLFSRRLSYSYEIHDIKRGEYHFTKIRLRTSDPFGLFPKEKIVSKKDLVIVYPNYQQLDDWTIYSQNVSEAHVTSQHLTTDVTSVAGSREYIPGDRLTSIDWKVTARVNKLMTKEFEDQLGQRFLLALDSSIHDSIEVVEKAIAFTASLVVQSSHQKKPLGLVTVEDELTRFPIQYGQAHQLTLIEHLAKLPFYRGGVFDEMFMKEINRIETNTIVFIIQTKLSPKTIENVKILQGKGNNVVYCYVTDKRILSEKEQTQISLLKQYKAKVHVLIGGNFRVDLSGGERNVT